MCTSVRVKVQRNRWRYIPPRISTEGEGEGRRRRARWKVEFSFGEVRRDEIKSWKFVASRNFQRRADTFRKEGGGEGGGAQKPINL